MHPSAPFRPPGRPVFLAAAAFAFVGLRTVAAEEPLPRVEVPPVVQRCPAYCAPASLVRALAVEGIEADQDELARIGGCSPEEGAALDAFCARLSPWLRSRGLRFRVLSEMSAHEALDQARLYNRMAEEEGGSPLLLPPPDSREPIALERLFEGARLEIMRRLSEEGLPAFRARVRSILAEGRPLLWGVVLGIADEPCAPAAASRGGHLRLIVGHDSETGRVLYTDPWGPSCSVRSMPEEDACAITMSLRALAPYSPNPEIDRILNAPDEIDRILNGPSEIDRILNGQD